MFVRPRMLIDVISALAFVLGLNGYASALGAPVINDLKIEQNPNPAAPLAAICTFTTDVPTRATIEIHDGVSTTVATPEREFTTTHRIPVLGLRPSTANEIGITVEDESGNRTPSAPLRFEAPGPPEAYPPIEVKVSRPRKMEPGVTFVPLLYWPGNQPTRDFGLVLALNAHGEVVWYYKADHTIPDVYRLQNGNILYQSERDGRMAEIDMLGNIVRRWYTTNIPKKDSEGTIPVAADTFHHDQVQLPNGNLLVLSTEVREFDDYYSSETDSDAERKPAQVIGDVILEMTKKGDIVREWKVFDILDPYRIGHGSLGTGFYAEAYRNVLESPAMDWAHTNSIFHDSRDNSMILSSYHLDVIYKVDMDSGNLVWLLGNHHGWKKPFQKYLLNPVGEDFRWPFHQHAAKVTPRGTLLLFDNGTHGVPAFQPSKPAEDIWSRAVEYRVDEKNMTVEELWSYGGPDDEIFFSPFISDTDWLPETGNILITDGGRMRDGEGNDTANFMGAHHWSRILEVTHEDPAEKVWEIVLDDPEAGWAVYRSQRMSLYP